MATCTRALLPPPIPAKMIVDPGKERASWLPEPEKEMPVPYLPPAIAPSDLAKPGKERGSWLLPEKEIEEKEKPLARLAPATAPADVAGPVKKMRRPVPMTDEDRNKIKHLKEQHQSAVKELHELREERKDLRKNYDDLVFRRRCLAARLVSRVVFHRRDEAYVRHELAIGLKLGDKLPEELKKARKPITQALVMWADMGRAVQIGMDNFIAEFSNPQEYFTRIHKEMALKDFRDEEVEAPMNPVSDK
ncbi:unnamed protein product [Alopecurus aequalis]